MQDYFQELALSGAIALMVALRCAPVLVPSEAIIRHGAALTIASWFAVSLALLFALFRLFSLEQGLLLTSLIFAGSGFLLFAVLRSLAAALVGATLVYLTTRFVL